MWNRIKLMFAWLRGKMSWKIARRILAGVSIVVFFYYLIGMVVVENINDDRSYASSTLTDTSVGSHAVAMSAAMIDREVNQHAWISNDPWFKPGALLDNMAHYQKGIISANAIFAIELKDQLSRTRGSSQVDKNLQDVARSDNLLSTLDKFSLDMGSSSDAIAKKIDNGIGCVLDTRADDLFYDVKGRSYAYWLLLKGLRADFNKVITDKDIASSWDLLEQSLSALIDLDPMIVSNCDTDDFLFQNHIAAQGFYLLRARTQLKEITNILLK